MRTEKWKERDFSHQETFDRALAAIRGEPYVNKLKKPERAIRIRRLNQASHNPILRIRHKVSKRPSTPSREVLKNSSGKVGELVRAGWKKLPSILGKGAAETVQKGATEGMTKGALLVGGFLGSLAFRGLSALLHTVTKGWWPHGH